MSASERMLSILPRYYDRSKVMQNLQKAIGAELDLLQARMMEIEREFSPSTAVETIGDWEKEYGVVTADSSLAVRRAAILSAMRARKSTTKETLRALAESAFGARCEVSESPETHQVILACYGNIPTEAIRWVAFAAEKIMPAHLELVIVQKKAETEQVYVAATSIVSKMIVKEVAV